MHDERLPSACKSHFCVYCNVLVQLVFELVCYSVAYIILSSECDARQLRATADACASILFLPELVMGVMLGVSRGIPRAHESMKRGEWAKKEFHGRSLKGKVLGIVGFGSVGQEVNWRYFQ